MKTWHKIIIGDSRWMKEIPDESVHLVITSPPEVDYKEILKGIISRNTLEAMIKKSKIYYSFSGYITHTLIN